MDSLTLESLPKMTWRVFQIIVRRRSVCCVNCPAMVLAHGQWQSCLRALSSWAKRIGVKNIYFLLPAKYHLSNTRCISKQQNSSQKKFFPNLFLRSANNKFSFSLGELRLCLSANSRWSRTDGIVHTSSRQKIVCASLSPPPQSPPPPPLFPFLQLFQSLRCLRGHFAISFFSHPLSYSVSFLRSTSFGSLCV